MSCDFAFCIFFLMAVLRLDIINFNSFAFYLFVSHTSVGRGLFAVVVVVDVFLFFFSFANFAADVVNMAIKRNETPQHDILNEIISSPSNIYLCISNLRF